MMVKAVLATFLRLRKRLQKWTKRLSRTQLFNFQKNNTKDKFRPESKMFYVLSLVIFPVSGIQALCESDNVTCHCA